MRNSVAILILLLFFLPTRSSADQVFEVSVSLNTSQISTTDYNYLDDLAPLVEEYLESNTWTDDRFEEVERIHVNIQIVFNSVDSRTFNASLVITSERPIYNTLQITPLIVLNDNSWTFDYARNQSLYFDQYQYHDIASVLDFYAYLILGYDYDSYSEKGGDPYFREAQRIAELGQSAGTGWTSTGSRRSRSDLISQLLNPNYEEFRRAIYRYHRHGLDLFTQEPEQSRDNILEAFDLIYASQRKTTERYLFEILFSAKHREFRAIFMDADTERRLEAYNILTTIDDSRISEYDRLQR
ncbi:MAG: DUF4835 family protein [Balneolales bacterium]